MSDHTVTLATGAKFPLLGLGTWQSPPGEVKQAVLSAVEYGYRHIDCAYVYGNESEIGEALKQIFDSGKVKREELFITSKLWNTFHRPDLVKEAVQRTLKALGLTYLDLYLVHWPHAFKEGEDNFPKKPDGTIIYSDAHYKDTWPAMEALQDGGLVKAIGLSNFNHKQIEDILSIAKIKPAVLQVECHPYFPQNKLIQYARSKNIVVTAYSPLGSPSRPNSNSTDPVLLEDPKLAEIGKAHNKSPAQVALRWQIERGVVVIPKSVTPSRIKSNGELFDFKLTPEEIETINSINRNLRFCSLTRDAGHPLYPFHEEY
eukprot:TRINITY_DN28_c0_g1_i1.p1 TRINITY_DN28_c0_g1~~TRINITY_DN28_c0_g1_i1.p1  ORF type:complete len:316 (-),score=57.20 TRINITY_DN28_c0_g1_i1:70-1017(-)